jgi:Cof subfamily protein (haloacid dehalogenase superfamily)
MAARDFDALLIDLDGTLVSDTGEVRPRNLESLKRLHADGVRVMLATGRSEVGARPVLEQLGFDTPALVFNGAGLYCPVSWRMLEERVLSEKTVTRALAYSSEHDLLTMVVRTGAKFTLQPRNEFEDRAIRYFDDIVISTRADLPIENAIRVTLLSESHATSEHLHDGVQAAVGEPMYVTHFPLNVLADHRDSPLLIADIQPPCRGKAEGLRILEERSGSPAERVLAIGDASNDVPMLEAAGLGVAMANSMGQALEVADRTIGDNNSDAIADLLEELFGR